MNGSPIVKLLLCIKLNHCLTLIQFRKLGYRNVTKLRRSSKLKPLSYNSSFLCMIFEENYMCNFRQNSQYKLVVVSWHVCSVRSCLDVVSLKWPPHGSRAIMMRSNTLFQLSHIFADGYDTTNKLRCIIISEIKVYILKLWVEESNVENNALTH